MTKGPETEILAVGIPLIKDERMSRHTTMRVGGEASYYVRPKNVRELLLVLRIFGEASVPRRIFGGGSNLIVGDSGVDAAVISFSGSVDEPEISGDLVTAEASIALPFLLRCTAANGFSGLEFLAGVPGTLGGALRMNAGTRTEWIGARVESVQVLRPSGKTATLEKRDLSFGYRASPFGKNDILLSACLRLQLSSAENVRNAIRKRLENKRKTQPVQKKSAGCIFKNPEGVSAGELIESAGLKSFSCGGATVSDLHANFIINRGDATASDVIYLIDYIKDKVWNKTGIRLQEEVVLWDEKIFSRGA